MSQIVHQTPKYIIRATGPIHPGALLWITRGLEAGFKHLGMDGVLFVTVLDHHEIIDRDSPDWNGVAMYHSGIETLVFAGVPGPRDNETDWLDELYRAAIQQTVHYWQDSEGMMHAKCSRPDLVSRADIITRSIVQREQNLV